jgi:hypothetical protein
MENVEEKIFFGILFLALVVFISGLGFFLFNVANADHSIVRYEIGSTSYATSVSGECWTIVGVRNYWTDALIYFTKKEYTLEQVQEKVKELNMLLIEQVIRELKD